MRRARRRRRRKRRGRKGERMVMMRGLTGRSLMMTRRGGRALRRSYGGACRMAGAAGAEGD